MKLQKISSTKSILFFIFWLFCFLIPSYSWGDSKFDSQIDRLKKKYLIPEIENSESDDFYLEQVRTVVKESISSEAWPIPGSSISTPTGFGAQWKEVFAGGSITTGAYGGTRLDGTAVFGFGLGDPKVIGAEIDINAYSIIPPFRSGDITLKVHRLLPKGFGVAIGREGLIQWNSSTMSNFFASLSKYILLNDNENALASMIILSLGTGNGKYNLLNSANDVVVSEAYWAIFFGASVRVQKYLSFNVNYSGRDLGVGFAATPFKKFPLNIALNALDVLKQTPYGLRFSLTGSIGHRF